MAVKESKDGSGVLAVASRDVVVLHDTKRGKEQSWGLNAPQEEVRHLEYSNDGTSLFLSTASDGLIQQYSTARSRLLEPVQKHSSAPVALAISPTEQLMVSASGTPPVVYLKSLEDNLTGALIQPGASTAPVCAAAFHPQRPNIFMLAFRDATVAAYDSTKVSADAGRYTIQVANKNGEISYLPNLHRKVTTGDLSLNTVDAAAPVTGVAFLPGHKLRAVTAGRDGRCRIVDFAKGGAILRTWNCKAPCTSISVLTAQRFIAVGLMSGVVQIYNAVGMLLVQEKVTSLEEKVISVEWVNGPSPQPLDGAGIGQFDEEASVLAIDSKHGTRSSTMPLRQDPEESRRKDKRKDNTGLGLPSDLRSRRTEMETRQRTRQLTFHPDELIGTGPSQISMPKRPAPVQPTSRPRSYSFSLGSDVADVVEPTTTYKRVSSAHRDRPRLSHHTFKQRSVSSMTKPEPLRLVLSPPASSDGNELEIFDDLPTSDTKESKFIKQPVGRGPPKQSTLPRTQLPPQASSAEDDLILDSAATSDEYLGKRPSWKPSRPRTTNGSRGRHITFKPSAMSLGDATVVSSERAPSVRVTRNARNLPRLRGDAPVMDGYRYRDQAGNMQTSYRGLPSPAELSHVKDDVWLTEGEDDEADKERQQRSTQFKVKATKARPGRDIPENRDGKDQSAFCSSSNVHPAHREDEKGATALPLLAAHSQGVRELFPRSSSLSPFKTKRHSKQAKRRPAMHGGDGTRQRAMLGGDGTVAKPSRPMPVTKSPWIRARAQRSTNVRKNEFVTVLGVQDGAMDMPPSLVRSQSFGCLTCPETKARVSALEKEVETLKRELSILKGGPAKSGAGLLRWTRVV